MSLDQEMQAVLKYSKETFASQADAGPLGLLPRGHFLSNAE